MSSLLAVREISPFDFKIYVKSIQECQRAQLSDILDPSEEAHSGPSQASKTDILGEQLTALNQRC